jgi:transposase
MQRLSTSRSYQLFAGIDVSAATVTVSWMAAGERPSRPITIEQTATGYAFLHQRLCATGISPQAILVVLEATGSYWITLATTLVEAGFAVSVINPAQAHDFAKALLKRAKTDDLDAQMLAELLRGSSPNRGRHHQRSMLNSSSASCSANRSSKSELKSAISAMPCCVSHTLLLLSSSVWMNSLIHSSSRLLMLSASLRSRCVKMRLGLPLPNAYRRFRVLAC